ncbi:MAG TPA: DUF6222 family protein [Pseudonocardiaceae bacterium]|nr:DUF6222 family protein [Pseudonocardiaceae bacterium]
MMNRPDVTRPALASVPAPAEDEEEYVFPRPTSLPRLGRGIVWANILADIEQDHERREAA